MRSMLGYFANQLRDVAPFVFASRIVQSSDIALCFVRISTLNARVSLQLTMPGDDTIGAYRVGTHL